MPLVNIARGMPGFSGVCASMVTYALNAVGRKCAVLYGCDRAYTFDKVRFRVDGKTGTPGVLRVGIQSVVDTRAPSGTFLAGGNAFDTVTNPAILWHERTLGSPVTVAKNDVIAVVVEAESGTWDGSNNVNITTRLNAMPAYPLNPIALEWNGSSWAETGQHGLIAPLASTGDIPAHAQALLVDAVTDVSAGWTSIANPLWRANLYAPTVAEEIDAVSFTWYQDAGNLADVQLGVFVDGNAEALRSRSLDVSRECRRQLGQLITVPIAPLLLEPPNIYAFALAPLTLTAPSGFHLASFSTAARRQAAYGPLYAATAATLPDAWSENTLAAYPIFPVTSRVLAGGGSAGRVHSMRL